MTSRLLSSFALLTALPLTANAQVLAGDATGLAHTTVGILIAPPLVIGGSISNGTTIDLEGDAMNDLQFEAGNVHATDANGSWTGSNMLHEGVEVAVDGPGGYVAKRLDLLDPVDGSLTWRAYVNGGGNSLVLAQLLTNFGGQWDATGAAQWFINGSNPTPGYMGVRTVQAGDTLYGWVNLTSYVAQDSSWLQIDDFAIESGSTAISDDQRSIGITAALNPNGALTVQGSAGELLHITLRDLSGRVVRQNAAPSPCRLDIASEAHGIYVLVVNERTRSHSFKLAW